LVLWVAEDPAPTPPGGLRKLMILGLVGNTFYQLVFTIGLSQTTATNSALILSTVPT
jgi:drug/metabolite transporter (DMT)-like permease